MSKKSIVCALFLLLFSVMPVLAEEGFRNPSYTKQEIDEQENMLYRVEKVFPKFLLWETFDVATKPTVEKSDSGFYYSEINTRAGKYEITVAAVNTARNEFNLGDSHFRITGSYTDFYVSIEAQLIEWDDSQKGYIFFQYTNREIVGEKNSSTVELLYPQEVRKCVNNASGRNCTTYYDLSAYKNDYNVHKFEFFRSNGYARFFIDGNYIAGFKDGIDGRCTSLYGSGLLPGGKYVTGSFDEFKFRAK